jgi:hypothetical protein
MSPFPWISVMLAGGLSAVGADPEAPTGAWRSVGYGLVWRFDGELLTTYEITTTTCLASTVYRRDRSIPATIAYRADSALGAVANDWVIRSRRNAGRLVAHTPGTVADVEFTRIPAVPDRCQVPTADTRDAVFETFTRTMAEHYAFFRERKVDWPAAVARARSRLPSVTDDRAFYQILHEMVAPLGDAHTDVTATNLNLRLRNYRQTERSLDPELVLRLRRLAPPGIVGDTLTFYDDGRLGFGWLPDSVGYLRVNLLYGFAGTGRFEDDSVALERTLDLVMPRAARARKLVLDLRVNGGGYDALARLLVSHFTARGYPALIKRARVPAPGGAPRYTPPTTVRVEPAPRHRFLGPMAILTGIHTLSAGEVLTLMLMGRRPRPIRVGEPTHGIFADELVRRLPNGWKFQLTSERYTTPAGASFEGPGIPPDVVVPVYPADERDGTKDSGLAEALRRLGGRP